MEGVDSQLKLVGLPSKGQQSPGNQFCICQMNSCNGSAKVTGHTQYPSIFVLLHASVVRLLVPENNNRDIPSLGSHLAVK